MRVWLAMDPESLRVLMQDREFADGDFPSGLRGLGWPRRDGEVDDETWSTLLAGELTPDETDDLHRATWSASGPTDWPEL